MLDQTALRRQRGEMQAADLVSASLAANVFTFIAAAAIQRGPWMNGVNPVITEHSVTLIWRSHRYSAALWSLFHLPSLVGRSDKMHVALGTVHAVITPW